MTNASGKFKLVDQPAAPWGIRMQCHIILQSFCSVIEFMKIANQIRVSKLVHQSASSSNKQKSAIYNQFNSFQDAIAIRAKQGSKYIISSRFK